MRNPIIEEDLRAIRQADLPWEEFRDRVVLVTGANGFLPAYLVETLLSLNETSPGHNTRVVALVRDRARAEARFAHHRGRPDLELLVQDVCQPLPAGLHADFVIHAASQASPKYFGRDPVGTLSANVLGTHHLLTAARAWGVHGFLFFSSSEVYGQVDPSRMPIRETDHAGLNPVDVRSCYAESKRLGETMAVSWWHQFQVPVRIVRPFHTYGPGMSLDDGRVFADFVADIVHRRPIVLRSAGTATRAFCYLADAVAGFFTVLLRGQNGEAYNIGNDQCECSIAALAELLVGLFPERQLSVTYERDERGQGYLASKVSRSCPDIGKAKALGWQPATSLVDGFRRTIQSYEIPSGLQAVRARYRAGELTKHQYIEAMHGQHARLFEYAEYLRDTEVGHIEIRDGEVLMTSRDGVRFLCDPLDRRQSAVEALNFGRYEGADADLFWQLLRPGLTVFDVGANVGWYTLHIARRYPGCRVIAFEPVPVTFARLQKNLALNELNNVELHPFGLSNQDGPLTFYFYPEGSGGASAANNSGLPSVRPITCRVRRCDDFVAETGIVPDLIKCDVEGAELFVFQGARTCLERHRPLIFCEMLRKWAAQFGYHPNAIIDLLAGLGYACYEANAAGLQPLARVEETTAATNYFFLHTEKHADVLERLIRVSKGTRQAA
jgi:FkbM family methyltransferase